MPCTTCCFVCFYRPAFCRVCVCSYYGLSVCSQINMNWNETIKMRITPQTFAIADTVKNTKNDWKLQIFATETYLLTTALLPNLVINFSNSKWINSFNTAISNGSMYFCVFCVLVFSLTMGVRRIFSRGEDNCGFFFRWWPKALFKGANYGEIPVYQLKTNRKIFFVEKYQILKSRDSKPLPPFDVHELDQIRKSFLWYVCGSHDHLLLQSFQCNFFILWGFK